MENHIGRWSDYGSVVIRVNIITARVGEAHFGCFIAVLKFMLAYFGGGGGGRYGQHIEDLVSVGN